MTNQHPEQIARDKIDRMLIGAGWVIQSKHQINLAAIRGVAIQHFCLLQQLNPPQIKI